MQWSDEAIVLGVRRHGETSVIAEVMTRGRGRHLGMVRGGRSRKQQPILQAGNRVELIWRARLDEHGIEVVEAPIESLDLENDRICAVNVAGKEHRFDVLYSALGLKYRSDLAISLGAAHDPSGCLLVDSHCQTSVKGLYAAGDIVRGASLVVWAIRDGREAADAILSYLTQTGAVAAE